MISNQVLEASQYVKSKTKLAPQVGVVLGSGLGGLVDKVKSPISIPYSEIPHFKQTRVEGHAGVLVLGELGGKTVAILKGRYHFYEGHSMHEIVHPTRTLCALGIKTLLLTNAAGAVNPRYRPGEIMIIEDHINLMGDNPLRGPLQAQLGPPFADLTETYPQTLVKKLEEAAQESSIRAHKGVYCAMSGPTYETPAEVKMLRTLGADAVGMSSVPEAIAAAHMGIPVCGLSLITNFAAGLQASGSPKMSHQEVIRNSELGLEQVIKLIENVISK